jgi:hypothetical protein
LLRLSGRRPAEDAARKKRTMTIKHIELTVDALAKTANAAVADAHELGTKTLNEAGGVVAEGKAAANSIAKTFSERIDEAVQRAGHGARRLADKVAHSAQRISEALAQATKEAAARRAARSRGGSPPARP